jgi:hypothetical protein
MIRKIALRPAQTAYVRDALENPADLRQIRVRPTWRMIAGLGLVGFSYLIGWPAVAVLGILAAFFRKPLIVVVGGPVTYGLSHIVFLVGAWLAGASYVRLLTRYAAGALFKKLLRPGTST